MPDIDVTCSDCQITFVLTEGEQKWLTDRFGPNYHAPKRCRPCRQRRKEVEQAKQQQS